ncbi:peptide-methionine (S)-S-oxide reductase MsrA [Candidatus Woesebacteria bacterium]|nr:peptide-methionine (S)-S-oxide reductase MsrA [Candidatus Woesebacteria bacterium]
MIFLIISILAGILTVLAPCILPLLPIVVGSSAEGDRRLSTRSIVVISSLSVSVIVFTLLLKASTLLIAVPQSFWNTLSGSILILVGFAITLPNLWSRVTFLQKITDLANRLMGIGRQKNNYVGDMLTGAALGPVFTTCSPTYLYIIATVLPIGIVEGTIYLLGFTAGLALSLLLIAIYGGALVKKFTNHMTATVNVKRGFGVLIILVGLAIMSGYDKKIETAILDAGYGATINIEESLIERFAPSSIREDKILMNKETMTNSNYKTITLAGGCFWCTEANFQEQPGVVDAVSGYTGGTSADADYLTVAKGKTRHRESVQITYDPAVITIEQILDIYWSHMDPTDTEGQFADRGYQYTTAIYYHDDEQQKAAIDSKYRLAESGLFEEAIATEILPQTEFYPAEEYHQDYYKKAGEHYERYKNGSGRAGFIEETWAKDAAIKFLESEK